ncbi:MAG: hypothetical protein HUU35_02410 [Armatimonadetes bacterium]|nr:hypothetical protein [Armatimonadota bacterium]
MHPEYDPRQPAVGPAHRAPQGRGLTAIDGALGLISVLLIVQMWLLTTTLQLFLAGHRQVAVPAAILSGLLFAGCFAFYLMIDRLDYQVRATEDSLEE